jgi:hypothetical protein
LLIVNPRIKQANGRRIAGKNFGCKGINLVDGYFHLSCPVFVERKDHWPEKRWSDGTTGYVVHIRING